MTRSWRTTLFAATAPVLLLGFFASALANRLVFAGWGVLVAAVMVPVLRRAFEERSQPRSAAVTAVLGVLAPALALFGWLAGRNREELDLGGRAVLVSLHAPLAAAPATWYALAIVALAGAALCRWRLARARKRVARGRREAGASV